MRLARRTLVLAFTTLMLCTAVSAQALEPADDLNPIAPTVSTSNPPGGPVGLFTVYDGQTLRRGEFTFSIAYSNFDRDSGNVDITKIPFRFQVGVGDHLELFFNTDTCRSNKVNSPLKLSGLYLLHSQLYFGAGLATLRQCPTMVLSPNGVPFLTNRSVFRPTGGPFIQYPYMPFSSTTILPRFTISTDVMANPNTGNFGLADIFPGIGSPSGSIRPGPVLASNFIVLGPNIVEASTTFASVPSYFSDAPFLNRPSGQSAFNTFVVGAEGRLTGPDHAFGFGLLQFYRFYADKAGDFGGFNQMQRGASPGGNIGDYSSGIIVDGRFNRSVNLSANVSYILNSDPESSAFGSDLLFDRPDNFISEGNFGFLINKPFQPVTKANSVQYTGGRTLDALQNNLVNVLAGVPTFSRGAFGLSAGYIWHTNQQGSRYLNDSVPEGDPTKSIAIDNEQALRRREYGFLFTRHFGNLRSSDPFTVSQPLEQPFYNGMSLRSTKPEILIEADKLFVDGTLLQAKGTAQSFHEAISKYKEAMPVFLSANDIAKTASTQQNIADVYSSLGDYQQAVDNYNSALSFKRTLGDKIGEVKILISIGIAYSALGESAKALESFNQSLLLRKSIGDNIEDPSVLYDLEGLTLNGIGSVYASSGDSAKALDYYSQALALFRRTRNSRGEASNLNNTGKLYNSFGEYPKALEYLNKALIITKEMGDRQGQADTLYDIGNIYLNQSKIKESADCYERSLSLFRDIGDRIGESLTLNGLGRVYASLNEYQKALNSYNGAFSLARTLDNSRSMAGTLVDIGRVYKALGDNQKALDQYSQALTLNRTLGNRNSEAQTLYEIALVDRDTHNLDQSRGQIETALKIIDSLRTNIPRSELRSTYFASVQKYYNFYIDLLVQQHNQSPLAGFDAMALEASERARARRLLELLNEAQTNMSQGVDPQLIEREKSLQQELNNKAARQIQLLNSQHTTEQAESIAKEIEELTNAYQAVQLKISSQSPNYAALTQPEPLSLKEIREQVLDDNTLLLEYVLGDERSFLFAVTLNSISISVLPKRADIERVALEAYQALTSGARIDQRTSRRMANTQYKEISHRLSEMLLGPVSKQLGTQRLLIVAQGALQFVPFGALPAPNVTLSAGAPEYLPLIVNHEIVNLPSASTLAILRRETVGRKSPPKAVAVLADPVVSKKDERIAANSTRYSGTGSNGNADNKINQSLPRLLGTRWEAEQIAALTSPSESMLALDFTANRATAMSPDLSKYRIVHFATHGFINEEHPELSGIVLSLFDKQGRPENGFLRLNEITNMKLPVELVVLSGCATGMGKEINGEGLIGLTRGFMYAGAPRVVVSLWSVDDQATADLMVRFYRKMLKEGLRPAAALRAAQIEMWKDSRWNFPYFWASFMFQGEWR